MKALLILLGYLMAVALTLLFNYGAHRNDPKGEA